MGDGDTYHIDVHLTVGGSVVKEVVQEQDLVRSIRDGLIRLQRNDNIRLAHYGATAEETPQRQCPGCDKAFTRGTGHGKSCGRRCATLHGNQTAALARAADLVEDFEARLDRAVGEALGRVLTLTITEVVPAAVKKEVAAQVAAAEAPVAAKPAAEPAPKPPAKSWAQQNEEVERTVEAITRRLHDLPTGWQQLTVARGANGYQDKVLY